MSTLRERVAREIRPLIVDYGADMGDESAKEMSERYVTAILRLISEDRRALVEAAQACQAEAQCYCDGCNRIRAMHAALAAAEEPNAETVAVMSDSITGRNVVKFDTAEQMFAALDDGWISVKEHLPMLDVPVMIFGERCKNGIGEYWGPEVEGGVTVREGWYSDYGEPIDVTHWRPLPEPPKEEEK